MDYLISPTALNLISAATIGGLVAWAGNYYVQDRIHNYLHRTGKLRQSFYDYLDLVLIYWTDSENDKAKRRILEAKMIVAQRVISSEYRLLANNHRRIRKSYEETEELRMDLWDAATGGCFQQEDWESDLERVKSVARAVTRIANALG